MIKKEDLLIIYNQVFNKKKPYSLRVLSEASGKSQELSILEQMKIDYPILNVIKGDDFLALNELRGQIKNDGLSLLCSYDIGKINNEGKIEKVNDFVKELYSSIIDKESINFFELSGKNKYFYNESVDEFCMNYLCLYHIMCIYDKDHYTLYNPIKYCYGKKFKCEIRSSGKNSSKLTAIDYVSEKLKDFKKDDHYIINKSYFLNGKARNKNGKSNRHKLNFLPFCFYVSKVEDFNENEYKIYLEDFKQLIPSIAFYIEK